MQATSALYDELIQQIGHVKEVRLLVAGEEYASDRIVSMESDCRLFEQDTVCAGSAVSHQLDVVLHGAGEIPRGAKLIPQYRLSYAGRVSEWIQKGVYYIDTREPDVATDTLAIHAYDDMLRMEAPWEPSQELNFPLPMDRAAAEIARYYGLTIDSRSRLRSDYYIDYPASGTSGRTIFKHIAAAHGGNWTMTDKGEARLVRLRDLDSESGLLVTEAGSPIAFGDVVLIVDDMEEPAYDGPSDNVYVGQRVAELSDPPAFEPISKVVIFIDDEQVYEAGDDSGRTLEVTCPYGTQAMADNLLAELKGYRYRPMEARDALLDPATELGDGVTVNGIYTVAAVITTTYDALMASDILAPGERELESETGSFVGPLMQYMARKNAETHALISKTADNIRAEVSKTYATSESVQSTVDQAADAVRTEVKRTYATSESVSEFADAVTESLGTLQSQIDGQIETHYYSAAPTLQNAPASGWKTELERQKHEGDLYFDRTTGYAYRFFKAGNAWTWQLIRDTDITKALKQAESAQDTADNKRRVFTAQPTPPYDVGDLWAGGPTGELMRCNTARASGAYNASDWGKASKYTDDTKANSAYTLAEQTDKHFRWLVKGEDESTFTLTERMAELTAKTINLSGYVTITNIGSPGKVEIDGGNLKAGTVQADKLDVDDLFALHATIGGWSIADASGLVYENDTRGAGIRPNNSGSVIYIGKRANKNAAWEYPFYVSADGQLHAEDAYIKGEVHATSGTFESITIGKATITGSEFDGKLNSATGTLNGVTGTFAGTHSGGTLSGTGGTFNGTHSGGSLSNTGGSFTGTNSGKLTGTAEKATLSGCGLGGTSLATGKGAGRIGTDETGTVVLSGEVYAAVKCGTASVIVSESGTRANGGMEVYGGLTVQGNKSRAIATRHFGTRCLDALETALPTFADYGEGTLDESGVCCLAMDPVFMETVDPHLAPTVFLTKYGEGDIWYDRDAGTQDMLVVRGTPGLAFAWEARFAQSNIDLQRLRVLDYDYMDLGGEADFVGDALAEWDRDPLNVDYAEEAFNYITDFERSLEAA